MLGLGELRNVVAAVLQCDKPDAARQRDRIIERTYRLYPAVPPHFRCPVSLLGLGIAMKRLLVAVVIAGSLFSFEAGAQERAGSAALGAVAGAIVLGPIGAVAGAFIGYSAGSRIAHSSEVERTASRSRIRREAQTAPVAQQQATTKVSSPASIKTPDTVAAGKTEPPVQGFD
jgi:hypothetical protein